VDPFSESLTNDALRRSLCLAFGAILFVLLIACANVANLLVAKGVTRRKEMALRAALGASRGRLMAQLLAEGLVLSVAGSTAGVALAYLSLDAVRPLLADYLPFTADLSLDGRALGFTAVVTIGVLMLAVLLPSLRASYTKFSGSLNQTGRGSTASGRSIRRTIVIGQVAATVVLLSGAALLSKSLVKLQQVDAGVRIDHVITMSADLPLTVYPSAESATRFYNVVVPRLRAVPGVEQASMSLSLPLEGEGWGENLGVPGAEATFHTGLKVVDSGYFETLGIPVVSGRGIQDGDRAGRPPIVVINQEAARNLSASFGIANPIGQTIRIDVPGYGTLPESEMLLQIVGVIRSERTGGLERPQGAIAYVPLAQAPRQDVKLLVRTTIDPFAAMSGIREAVRQVDPNLPLGDLRTMQQVKDQSMLWARQPTWALGAFAGVAALLAALGLYGVLAHAVAQQRREIAIRMALGARRGKVLSQVLRNAFSMLVVGLTAGLAGTYALTRALRSLLFHVSALDPTALSAACILMALVALLAAWVPASRAARVDPMTVIRDEG